MLERVRARNEWAFVSVLPQADRWLAALWWALVVVRGLLPAALAVAMGRLVGAAQRGELLTSALALVGIVFVLLQALAPVHQAVGANLGSRAAGCLYGRLARACVRPPGMAHLEDPRAARRRWSSCCAASTGRRGGAFWSTASTWRGCPSPPGASG